MNIGRVGVSRFAWLALSFAAAGCGPGGNGGPHGNGGSGGGGGSLGGGGGGGTNIIVGSCGVAPCGGDVVGNWTGSSACMDQATLSAEFLAMAKISCPTVSLGNVTLTPTGTLALAADMSFTGALNVDALVDVNYPAACVMPKTCADVQKTLQSIVGKNGVTAVTCTGTDACVCTTAQTISIINATGTWATSGTMLTFAGAPGGDGPFCVQGSSLHLIGLDLATMTMVSNDIVLTKQ